MNDFQRSLFLNVLLEMVPSENFSLQQAWASLTKHDFGLEELELSMLTKFWPVCRYD